MCQHRLTLRTCLLTLGLCLIAAHSAQGFGWKKHRYYPSTPTFYGSGIGFGGGRIVGNEIFFTELYPTVETFRTFGAVSVGGTSVSSESIRRIVRETVTEMGRTESQAGNQGTGNTGGSVVTPATTSSCEKLTTRVDQLIEDVKILEGKVERINNWIQAKEEEEREAQRLRMFAEIVLRSQQQQNEALSKAIKESLKVVKPDLSPEQLNELDRIFNKHFPAK